MSSTSATTDKATKERRTRSMYRRQRDGFRHLANTLLYGAFKQHLALSKRLVKATTQEQCAEIQGQCRLLEHFLGSPSYWHELLDREPADCLARVLSRADEAVAALPIDDECEEVVDELNGADDGWSMLSDEELSELQAQGWIQVIE